jgi:multidrug efflux pump subunit AcrA (membrane-fusion protein)
MIRKYIEGREISDLKLLSRISLCAIILLIGVLLMLYFESRKPKPKQRPPEETIRTLVVEEVKAEPVRIRVSGYGTVKPVNEVEISAEVTGNIVETKPMLEEGIIVKKGELLLKIDPSDYEIALKEAQAEITRLKGEKKIAEQTIEDTKDELVSVKKIYELETKEFERTSLLFSKKVQAQTQLNKAAQTLSSRRKELVSMKSSIRRNEIQIDTINAQLEKAMAQKSQAELNIKRCTISSPFNGRMKKVDLEGNEHVIAGEKLFIIANDKKLELPVSIDAFDASRALDLIEKSHRYSNWFANPKNVKVIIEWTENPERCKWLGRIARIESFNAETRTIVLALEPVEPLNPEKDSFPLVAGMFSKATIYGKILKDAVKIPWVAVQFDRDVYVVDQENRLQERKIEIFSSDGEKAIVSSGLKAGDRLVAQRLPRGIVNGMKVKPASAMTDSQPEEQKPENKEQKKDK